ncbi:hypothetical protein NIES2109_46610 [Nostoc sp. HK-01]|uniref:DUF1648 domain-containing protein n=2 Tax=Nostocales TaxID=1161 RepID=A0A1Z4GQ81_9CYAN|nr:DUF1648 domain-containing protein [Nostoc cycadae]BAY19518.1 hypothetical protein NIES21_53810 [Anabaenopsis circularis NIES-21]BBD61826.1 hypothetical protein NIES2109_46610 [Nostoc sp. HK-01]GBE93439.1 hypothetical protein NCWK1_3201 [Nostoc cycadae WK-1]
MSRYRPVLVIPQSSSAQILNWIALAGLVGLFSIAIYAWLTLPETIPIHFEIDGKVNGWGSKKILSLLPIIALAIYGFLTFISRYPHTFNYAVIITELNALRQYQIACSMLNWLKSEMVWIFAYIEWQIFHLATTENPHLEIWFVPVLIIIIFGTIGYWLSQSFMAH